MRHFGRYCISFVAIVLTLAMATTTSASPLWGDLEPGPYRVGFQVLYRFDPSRTYFPVPVDGGQVSAQTPGRPVRIMIWYPGTDRGTNVPLRFGDYLQVAPRARSFAGWNEMLQVRDRISASRQFSYTNRDSLLEILLDTETAAFSEIPAADGSFPVVLHSLGRNGYQLESTVLWEFLASRGFVVVTVPQLGSNTLHTHLGFNLPDLGLQAGDLAFALEQMRKFPNVDTERVAVLGHSSGGLVGLMMATRNRTIDAVVGLDASFIRADGAELLLSWPEFQASRLRLSILDLHSAFDPDRISTALMDTLAYSRRIHVGIDKATHFDFQNWPLYSVLTGIEDERGAEFRTVQEGEQIYLAVCRETARFLDAVFYGVEEDLWELVRQPVIPDTATFHMEYRVQAGKQVPYPEDLAQVFLDGKPWLGRERILAIRELYPDETVFTKREIDLLATQLELTGETESLLTLLDLAVQFWPGSVMARYRFAEALLAAGQQDDARVQYQNIVDLLGGQELDPESVEAKVLEASEERLEELGPGEPETESTNTAEPSSTDE